MIRTLFAAGVFTATLAMTVATATAAEAPRKDISFGVPVDVYKDPG